MYHLTTLEDNSKKYQSIPLNHIKGIFCFLPLLILSGCGSGIRPTKVEEFRVELHGQAQGTTWSVTYYDLRQRNFQAQIDSVLDKIDASISTYRSGSVIDKWNKSDSGGVVDGLFMEVLMESWNAYTASNGKFDPSVMPLVKYWGFGPERLVHPETADPAEIDKLKSLMLFDSLKVSNAQSEMLLSDIAYGEVKEPSYFLRKPVAGMQLDFNAIGQGWSVDKVAEFLESMEIKHYMVEIGGELVAGYPKPEGELWRFGIDKPLFNSDQRELQTIINLKNRALATSGNYRKFYEKDGVKYSHTIDPKTGYPVDHSLLSTTVVSSSAADADAMATAFMVMGKDSTVAFLKEHTYLSDYVYLIYDSAGVMKTYTSPEIKAYFEEIK